MQVPLANPIPYAASPFVIVTVGTYVIYMQISCLRGGTYGL